MSDQIENVEDIFEGIDAALRRAAQTAKRLAEQNGTPYVVIENKSIEEMQQPDIANKQYAVKCKLIRPNELT